MNKVLALSLAFSLLSQPAIGRSPQNDTGPSIPGSSTPSVSEMKMKQQIEKIGVGQKITLILLKGDEYYGTIAQIGVSEVQIVDVDLKQLISIQYDQLKKVRKGYGRLNSISGKRVNPRANRIILFAFLGFLLGITALAASSD